MRMNNSLEKFEIKKNLAPKSLILLHLQNCMNLSFFFKNEMKFVNFLPIFRSKF